MVKLSLGAWLRLSQFPEMGKDSSSIGTNMGGSRRCERRKHILEDRCGSVWWHGKDARK